MKRLIPFLLLLCITATASATTWFVRQGGGTLYNAGTNPTGQCDGQADVNYPGVGTNQHCAVSSVQYLYLNGVFGSSAWVIAGGDTVVIRGCAALPNESNPDPPHCRIGIIDPNNTFGLCHGVGTPWGCSMPPPPNGTLGAHTRILGGSEYDGVATGPINVYPYTTNNLAQLFGGFDTDVLWLKGAQYVDIEGLEITSHNGACSRVGSPPYPSACSTSIPLSDFSVSGIDTDNTSSHITLKDLYIHGFTSVGIGGSIGGPFILDHVMVAFNPFAGWNLDDGTIYGSGSTLTQSYVTMFGNGCLEEYPIVHAQFPAKGCWDANAGGFGDAWSGGPTPGSTTLLTTFTCDHCNASFNTKDAAIGPHTLLTNLTLTNSIFEGNMGQAAKWGLPPNSTSIVTGNVFLGNCERMSVLLPGAAQNFNSSTALGGSYLSLFCRAAGPLFDWFNDSTSTALFGNNTFVTYQPTIILGGCNTPGTCGSYVFKNNLVLGYSPSYSFSPFNPTPFTPPTLYNWGPGTTWTADHQIEFNVLGGDSCAGTVHCVDPLLVNEPAANQPVPETAFDNFDFHLQGGSPAIGAGVTYAGIPTTDLYGTPYPGTPMIGAVVPSGPATVATPTFSPVAGVYAGTQSVTLSTVTGGASIIYTTDGSTPTVTAMTCSITHGTLYSGPLTVATSITIKAIGCLAAANASSVGVAGYVITGSTPTFSPTGGTYSGTQTVTISASVGTVICYNTTGSPATNGTTGCAMGTLYTGPVSVSTSETLYAVAGGTGLADGSIGTASYTLTGPPQLTIQGTVTLKGSVTLK